MMVNRKYTRFANESVAQMLVTRLPLLAVSSLPVLLVNRQDLDKIFGNIYEKETTSEAY